MKTIISVKESEETEVKTLESIREEIWEEMLRLEDKRIDQWVDIKYQTLREVLQKLGHLDEAEVLSQEWIDEHKRVEGQFFVEYEVVPVKDLQNLLVPKQELPVIPKFVAEWFESNKDCLADAFAFRQTIYAKKPLDERDDIDNWFANTDDVMDILVSMKNGYEVEEEQKYVVELPNPNNHMGRHKNVFLNKKDGEVFIDSANLFVNDITKYGQYALTEEEIKKDFEWAWAFAKPVEEEEE